MYKALVLFVLVLIGCVSAGSGTFNVQSKHIERIVSPFKEPSNPLDWCPQCINTYDDFIQIVLDVILNYGILGTCGDLCGIVTNKTGSALLDFLCSVACDAVGLDEFIKLVERADIDPIYYCEEVKLCPINDNGDAKFKSFVILPAKGPMGTKFGVDFVYVSNNGTGTGEIAVDIKTVDKIPLSNSFLVEAQIPGTYGDRLVIDASPDPDCDPVQSQCEEWLPGIYNVTVTMCNGQCGSHHPHTQLYDIASGVFLITQE